MNSDKNLIRAKNLKILKEYLFKNGNAIKSEMAEYTGLSVVTINLLVKELIAENIISEGNLKSQPKGRPAINYYYNFDKEYYLLLSIQEEKKDNTKKLVIIGEVVNLNREVKYSNKLDFSDISQSNLLGIIKKFLSFDSRIIKICISFPGKVSNGEVVSSWYGYFDKWRITELIDKEFGIPSEIQNDAHVLTIGYSIENEILMDNTIVGIFYPEESTAGITILSDGKIVGGHSGLAGEGKYLPNVIFKDLPKNESRYLEQLIEIISIYNVVISPDIFVLSTADFDSGVIYDKISKSRIMNMQLNHPKIFFVDDLHKYLMSGLLSLTQDRMSSTTLKN